MCVHQRQRRLARRALALDLQALELGQPLFAEESEPEAQRRDVGS